MSLLLQFLRLRWDHEQNLRQHLITHDARPFTFLKRSLLILKYHLRPRHHQRSGCLILLYQLRLSDPTGVRDQAVLGINQA